MLEEQSKNFKHIRGLALTGWSRYDHLAVLCELLPASLPSLITNLITVSDGEFNYKETFAKFDGLMNCSKLSNRYNELAYNYDKDDSTLLGKDVYLYGRASPCNWAGKCTVCALCVLYETIRHDSKINKTMTTN